MALLAGCTAGTTAETKTNRAIAEPPPCSAKPGRPISEAKLRGVLAKRGIHLYRVDNCSWFRDPDRPNAPADPNTPVAMLGNLWDESRTDDYDRIVSAQGFIICSVWRKLAGGEKVERVKYEGDEETHLRALNISCAIYPDSTAQIDALAAGLAGLPGVRIQR